MCVSNFIILKVYRLFFMILFCCRNARSSTGPEINICNTIVPEEIPSCSPTTYKMIVDVKTSWESWWASHVKWFPVYITRAKLWLERHWFLPFRRRLEFSNSLYYIDTWNIHTYYAKLYYRSPPEVFQMSIRPQFFLILFLWCTWRIDYGPHIASTTRSS